VKVLDFNLADMFSFLLWTVPTVIGKPINCAIYCEIYPLNFTMPIYFALPANKLKQGIKKKRLLQIWHPGEVDRAVLL
jgi:predicted branched-subunit amino acid permease